MLPSHAMGSPLIEVEKLSLRYGPQESWVLRQIDMTLKPGMILGILGPNGAGKTSLLRCIMGLLKPTEGLVKLFGEAWNPRVGSPPVSGSREVHPSPRSQAPALQRGISPVSFEGRLRQIGVFLESPGLYRLLQAEEYLHYFARLYGVKPAQSRIDTLLHALRFDESKKPCGQLSQGNRQKLHLMRTLLHQPQLLLWDEPTDHLDPLAQELALHTLREYVATHHAAAIVASHRIEHLEGLCTHALFLNRGQITMAGPMPALLSRSMGMRIIWSQGSDSLTAAATENAHWQGHEALKPLLIEAKTQPLTGHSRIALPREAAGGLLIGPQDQDKGPDLVKSLALQGYRIIEVTSHHHSLGELYREACGDHALENKVGMTSAQLETATIAPQLPAPDVDSYQAIPNGSKPHTLPAFWPSAFTVAYHEWLHVRREPRFILPFVVVPLILILTQGYFLDARLHATTTGMGSGMVGSPDFSSLLPTLALLGALASALGIPLGADAFAGERERKSLEVLFCAPIHPAALFIGKALAILPLPWALGWAAQGLMTLIYVLRGGSLAEHGITATLLFMMTPLLATAVAATTLYVSARSPTVRQATQVLAPFLLVIFFTASTVLPWVLSQPGWTAVWGALLTALALKAWSASWLLLAWKRLRKPV